MRFGTSFPWKENSWLSWVNPNGSLYRLKAYLVTKGYSQIYGIDYKETFSHVTKLASVCLVILFVATYRWSLQQLDINNFFLHMVRLMKRFI